MTGKIYCGSIMQRDEQAVGGLAHETAHIFVILHNIISIIEKTTTKMSIFFKLGLIETIKLFVFGC